MEREIKFRGKRIDNDEWVYGCLQIYGDGSYVITTEAERIASQCIKGRDGVKRQFYNSYATTHEVDPETVGQFTGRKAGEEELYRGDIVRITAACGEEYIGEVVWDDNRSQWAVDIGHDLWSFGNIFVDCQHQVEKVGNRWDYPELLEVSK